jgi:hypothetical protein
MSSTDRAALLAAFAERLNDVCDEKGLPNHGRQSRLGRQFGVSQQSARKWLEGIAFPELDKLVAIADWGDVNVNWLLQGAGPRRGNRIDSKALVLDEAVKSLPRDAAIDIVDHVRAKLVRMGKITANEPDTRWSTMLDAYESELQKKRPQ